MWSTLSSKAASTSSGSTASVVSSSMLERAERVALVPDGPEREAGLDGHADCVTVSEVLA